MIFPGLAINLAAFGIICWATRYARRATLGCAGPPGRGRNGRFQTARLRCRQRALDRAFMDSGPVSEAIFDMLERLEGRRASAEQTAAPTK